MAMIRDARNVEFVRAGIFGKRWRLVGLARGSEPDPTFRDDDYQRIRSLQADVPVLVDDSRDRCCWWHAGDFYFSDPDLLSEDVHALLVERRLSKEGRLSRARSLAARDRATVNPIVLPVDQIDVDWEEVHITVDMAMESLEDYREDIARLEQGNLSELQPGEDVAGAIKRLREAAEFSEQVRSEGGRSYRRIYDPATHTRSIAIADDARYRELDHRRRQEPVRVGSSGSLSYWWYRDAFYEAPLMVEADEVASSVAGQPVSGRARRQPIPVEVRRAVYERDGGRCVECDATFDLHYDHVIPLALGGANSEQNLQLLCGGCNRRKSDGI